MNIVNDTKANLVCANTTALAILLIAQIFEPPLLANNDYLDSAVRNFFANDMHLAQLAPPTLIAISAAAINAVLKKTINPNIATVETYPFVTQDFVITNTSMYLVGGAKGTQLARVINEATTIGLLRVAHTQQLKEDCIRVKKNEWFNQIIPNIYGQLKEQYPEWDEERIKSQAIIETAQAVESYNALIMQEVEELSKTKEFNDAVHHRWLYQTTRHLGGLFLSDTASKLIAQERPSLLYSSSSNGNLSLLAGISATRSTIPFLTNLSRKIHPNFAIKHPSISLECCNNQDSNTQEFLVGFRATIFESELLRVRLKASKNLSSKGGMACGLILEAGM